MSFTRWPKGPCGVARSLDLHPSLRVLDVGSGLGGTAGYLARRHDVEVTGGDLTAEYVEVATSLTRRAGLAELVQFRQASATILPFSDGFFDRVCMLHVGMNIADKAALFAEIRWVMVAGGRFGVYDLMRVGPGDITYPVPWAGARRRVSSRDPNDTASYWRRPRYRCRPIVTVGVSESKRFTTYTLASLGMVCQRSACTL